MSESSERESVMCFWMYDKIDAIQLLLGSEFGAAAKASSKAWSTLL